MSVNRFWIPVVVIAALLGTIFGAQALGWWSISGRTDVNLEQFSPEDIKGWMTLQQLADGLRLSMDELYRIGGIPADIGPDTALKDMEETIEVSTLRDALAVYVADGDMANPAVEPGSDVAQITQSAPVPTTTVPASMHEVTAEIPEVSQHTDDGAGPTPLPPGQILPAGQIKGRMTLREVSEQCAVDFDALLSALNLPPDTDPNSQLKTLIQQGDLDEVTQVQGAVTVLQDQKVTPG